MKQINLETLRVINSNFGVLRNKCLDHIRSLQPAAYLSILVGYLIVNTGAVVLLLSFGAGFRFSDELSPSLFLVFLGFLITDRLTNPVLKLGGYWLITTGMMFVVFSSQTIATGFNNALFVVLFLSIAFSIIDWLINPFFTGKKSIWIGGSLAMTNWIILFYVFFIVNGIHH